MKIRNTLLILIFAVVFAGVFVGCSGIDGEIAGKREVLRKVDKYCSNEKYELVNVVEEDTLPKSATYYFKSKERELEFTAYSSLQQIYIDGPTNLYDKYISCNYIDAVREIYKPEINRVFADTGLYDDRDFNIREFNDLSKVTDAIIKASEIYSEELKYNSEEWLEKNPYSSVYIVSKNNENNVRVILGIFEINGKLDREMILHHIQMLYAQSISEGKLYEDSTVPKEVMDNVHRSEIDRIYVNGKLLTGEMANKNQGAEYNINDNIFTAYYSYDFMDYMIALDVAVTPKECGAHPLAVYLNEVGKNIMIDYDKGSANWEIGSNKYSLKAEQSSDEQYVNYLVVKRNKKDLDIHFTDEYVYATYLVAVPLKDLCKLLDCNVRINEKTGEIFLESR